MKMSFAPKQRMQPAVSEQQETMRAAVPQRLPVGRIIVGILVVLMFATLGLWIYLRTGIYSYGVVATGVEVFHAPVRSRVVSVHAEPGDRVVADTMLCVLVSDDAQTELKEAQETLGQQKGILETMLEQKTAAFDDPAVEIRDLQNAQARLHDLERQADAVAQARAAREAHQRQEIARLTRQVAFREELSAERERRLTEIQALRKEGAALPAEEAEVEQAAHLASYELDDAKAQLEAANDSQTVELARQAEEDAASKASADQAKAYVSTLTALYGKAREELERIRSRGIENIHSRISSLEARVANLRKLAGPTEIRALADGVVTEVFVTDGSNVPKDAELMSVSGTGKLWINAFVPPQRAGDLHIGASVVVYPTTGVAGIPGKVTAGGGIQYKVHPSLVDRINERSAIYVRIDLDQPKPDLIPGNVVKVVIR